MSRIEIPELLFTHEDNLLLAVESVDDEATQAGGLCYLEILYAETGERLGAVLLDVPGARILIEELEAMDTQTSVNLQRVNAALAIHHPCHLRSSTRSEAVPMGIGCWHLDTIEPPSCVGCRYDSNDEQTPWADHGPRGCTVDHSVPEPLWPEPGPGCTCPISDGA